jgi:hypothetical protein
MSNLGGVYDGEGEYAQAEALASQVLEISRRVLGPEHPDTLVSMAGLAPVYADEGKYGRAESLFSPTLEISRRGSENPDTLSFLSDFSYTSDRASTAMQAQTLAGWRHALGSETPEDDGLRGRSGARLPVAREVHQG